jgi:PAS domain S-box-containing protein
VDVISPLSLLQLQPTSRQNPLCAAPIFIETLPMAAYACDTLGQILWFNQKAVELWGRTPGVLDDDERFCGAYRLYFNGQLTARDAIPMAQVLRSGEAIQGREGIIERPDGTYIWVMVHIEPIRDEQGRLIGAINCFHDTTELHQVKSALRDSQDEIEDFFENGTVPLHLVSGDGIILRANKAELALLGYAPEEYIGRPIGICHADSEVLNDILSRLKRGERLERYPARLRAKDGTIKHVLITSSAKICNGQVINTRCFTVDVTAEKLAADRVTETEEQFRQLLEALPAAVYTTDAAGRITYFNRTAVDLAGRVPELGHDDWCVTWRLRQPDGTPLPHECCPMAIALKEQRPVRNVEALAERPDGTLVPILPYPTPLWDRNGKMTGAVNMLIDISERKQAETQQLLLLKELNHRVKNNMQMLQSLLNAAARESANPEARQVLADASQRVAAMAAAQKVLYEEGKPAHFAAQDFLESICAASQSAFSPAINISIGTTDGVLSNDTAMPLALILNELLTNAVKHGNNGSGKTSIRVGLSNDEISYQLSVEDEGPGFDLDSTVRRRASGLGLVARMARQLGGSFTVEQGKGARCIVQFDVRRTVLQ